VGEAGQEAWARREPTEPREPRGPPALQAATEAPGAAWTPATVKTAAGAVLRGAARGTRPVAVRPALKRSPGTTVPWAPRETTARRDPPGSTATRAPRA